MQVRLACVLRGVAGGVAGGIVGYFVFLWLWKQGFYGLMIPGALIGLGCSLLAGDRSVARGIMAAVAAGALSLYAEWKVVTFVADGSFSYMVLHFYEKPPVTLLMFAGGIILAYWIGKDSTFGGGRSPSYHVPPADRPDQDPPPGAE